jgi:hypothetical protein
MNMASDGSLASKTEDKIVSLLRALTEFADENVEPWSGSTSPDGETVVKELLAERDAYVTVWYTRRRADPLEEGAQRYLATYIVWIVVQVRREAASRRGDADHKGSNWYAEVARNALHHVHPGAADNDATGFGVDELIVEGDAVVYQGTNAFIVEIEVTAVESPKAA